MNNNGFTSILKGEFFKISVGKSLLKFVISYLVIFIVFTIVFFVLNNITGGYLNFEFLQPNEAEQVTTSEEIATIEEQIKENDNAIKQSSFPLKMANTSAYNLKARLALLKYAASHNLDVSSMKIYGNSSGVITTYEYINFMVSIMIVAITIYCIVTMCNKLGGEIKNGTMKMQLLRPISRDSLIGAKILSTIIMGAGLLIFTYILASIVGIIGFKNDTSTIYMVFNASKVIKTNVIGVIFLEMISNLYVIFCNIILAGFISLIMGNIAAAIPILSYIFFGSIESTLGYIGIGYIGFNLNMNWISCFTINGPSLNYMNIYSMIIISFAYVALMMSYLYLGFRKRDIQ